MTETTAGGTRIEIGIEMKLSPAVVTLSTGRDPLNDETRPFQQGSPTAGIEAELNGIGDNAGEFADLQDHDGNPLPLPMVETDINDALGQGKFVQQASLWAEKSSVLYFTVHTSKSLPRRKVVYT